MYANLISTFVGVKMLFWMEYGNTLTEILDFYIKLPCY